MKENQFMCNKLEGKKFNQIFTIPFDEIIPFLYKYYGKEYIDEKIKSLYETQTTLLSFDENRLDIIIKRACISDNQVDINCCMLLFIRRFFDGRLVPYEYNRGKTFDKRRNERHRDVMSKYDHKSLGHIHLYYVENMKTLRICDGHNRFLITLQKFIEDDLPIEYFCFNVGIRIEKFTTEKAFLDRQIKLNEVNLHNQKCYINNPDHALGYMTNEFLSIINVYEYLIYIKYYRKTFHTQLQHILIEYKIYGNIGVYNTPNQLAIKSKNLTPYNVPWEEVGPYPENLLIELLDCYLYYSILMYIIDNYTKNNSTLRSEYNKISTSTSFFSFIMRDRATIREKRIFNLSPVDLGLKFCSGDLGKISSMCRYLSNKEVKANTAITNLEEKNRSRINRNMFSEMIRKDIEINNLANRLKKI